MQRGSVCALTFLVCFAATGYASSQDVAKPPNILLAISDDQSFAHTSIAGYPAIHTPSFDRVAREGALFTQAFAASPGCSPSRAALLTGRYCWQLEHAGTHGSSFPAKYVTYPDLLEKAGYVVGFTGKGWGPGNFEVSGRSRNPAGPAWQSKKMDSPEGISNKDYAANFEEFIQARDPAKPFCFWFGAHEPHRVFKNGLGLEQGKQLEDAIVPPFLPDAPEVRSDILDYCAEIEWFDRHLGSMIALLEARGELENTIIVVTSDNGMSFPRAKANVYEYGIHIPLAIRWGNRVPAGRVIDELVSLTDLAPTFLAAVGVAHPGEDDRALAMIGRSLLPLLTGTEQSLAEPKRDAVYSARERHSSSRYETLGYPQRALRTADYLYIRNFHPERWPAGAPQKMGTGSYPRDETQPGPMHAGYHDIDACPTLDYLVENREDPDVSRYFHWSIDKRPAEELYAIGPDPGCLANLAELPDYAEIRQALSKRMDDFLSKTDDPRLVGDGEVFETYPRYGKHRVFPKPDWVN